MKRGRILILLAGVVFIGLSTALVTISLPVVQTFALQQVANRLGHPVQFERIHLGVTTLTAHGVVWSQAGRHFRVNNLEADYAPWRLLWGNELALSHVSLRGVEVAIRRSLNEQQAARAASAPVALPQLFTRAALPVALRVDQLDAQGQVRVGATIVDFTMNGEGIAPKKEGSIHLKANVRTAQVGDVPVPVEATLRVRQTSERSFDQVTLELLADPASLGLAEAGQLKLTVLAGVENGAAKNSLRLDLLRAGQAQTLLDLQANKAAKARDYTGYWRVRLVEEKLAPFFPNPRHPIFTIEGQGDLVLGSTWRSLRLKGQVNAKLERLETLDPRLRPLGKVSCQTDFSVAVDSDRIQLEPMKIEITGAQSGLSLETRLPLIMGRQGSIWRVGDVGVGELAHLKLNHLPLAWIRPFVTVADISGQTISGELAFSSRNRGMRGETVSDFKVSGLTVVQEGRAILEQADVNLHDAVVEVLPTGWSLRVAECSLRTPAGDKVQAQVQAATGLDQALAIKLNYTATLPRLLLPFGLPGTYRAEGAVDLSLHQAQAEVRTGNTKLVDGTGRTLLAAQALRPFIFNLEERRLEGLSEKEAELFRIEFGRWPLMALQTLGPGSALSGYLEPGEMRLSASAARWRFWSVEPLRLTLVTFKKDGTVWWQGLNFTTRPQLEVAGVADWKIQADGTQVSEARGDILANFDWQAVQTPAGGLGATMKFDANLAVLGRQPLMQGAMPLRSGRSSGEARATVNRQEVQADVNLRLADLVAQKDGPILPSAETKLSIRTPSPGHYLVTGPLVLTAPGRRSELNLTADVQREPMGGGNFTANLSGKTLELDDALALASVFALGSEKSTPSAPSSGAPMWARWTGAAEARCEELRRGPDWTMQNVEMRLRLQPGGAIQLDALRAKIGAAGQMEMAAALQPEAGGANWSSQARLSVKDFDAGAFLRAFAPGQPPIVEGIFQAGGELVGNGKTPAQAIEQMRGEMRLSAGSGVFRGLRGQAEKLDATNKKVQLGAALGVLLGNDRLKEAAQDVAAQSAQVAELTKMLGEFRFDKFNAQAVREVGLDVVLRQFEVHSSEIILSGQGRIRRTGELPWLQCPIALECQLSTRGKTGGLFDKLGLLAAQADAAGYTPLRQAVLISGTLGRPDASAFLQSLTRQKLANFLSP